MQLFITWLLIFVIKDRPHALLDPCDGLYFLIFDDLCALQLNQFFG